MTNSSAFQELTIAETFKHFDTSTHGLSSQEVKKRTELLGKNVLEEEKVSRFKILFRQFNNLLIYILFAASLISLAIGEWTDFFSITIIITANGLIGFWQELKAEASITALKKLTESKNKVMRNGTLLLLPSSELVPGDYLVFHEGEIVTADVRLVESRGLMVDESPITGESAPIIKDHTILLPKTALPYELKNMLLTGTTIVRGVGHGIVTQTGPRTYFASIAQKSTKKSPETPLTRSIGFFARRYLILIISLLSLLAIFGVIQGRNFLDLGYILIATLVSAVPEGLPVVLTVVMVVGALALSKKKTLVRYLPSVETLGSATLIASDKTGTITEGKLIVQETYTQNSLELKQIAALCNDSHEEQGDPLDVALAHWVENFDELKKQYPRTWTHSFDAKLMLMATAHEIDGKETLLVKGAYESLREKVENKEELFEVEKVFEDFLEKGLRVLAFGKGEWKRGDPASWKIHIVGLIGFLDPPKASVKESVLSAKSAGIRVIMITGDHPMTAKAVAKEVGIWTEGDHLLTGKEIELLSDIHLAEALKKTTVLARILPEHKYRVVKVLQSQKEIVAVTGDGVNDVPALKAADLGIAMGGGTEAAKSVSKMVITDNNLKVIINAIRNGRVIADNIRKVIYYLVSTSLLELTLISLSVLSSLPLPLSAIQILWINLITNGAQDKTFPFAKEEGDVMLRKPRSPDKQFFDLKQMIRIFAFGCTMGLICFLLYLYLLPFYSFTTVSTLIFTATAAAEWANGIQAQKEEEPFFRNIRRSFSINPYIFIGLAVGMLLQGIAIYLFPHWFHSTPLSLDLLIYPLFAFLAAFAIVEMRKWTELLFLKIFIKSHRSEV